MIDVPVSSHRQSQIHARKIRRDIPWDVGMRTTLQPHLMALELITIHEKEKTIMAE